MTTHGRLPEPVFIVGQYKCGTSWLLSVLSAHPDVVGTAELDIVRATYRIAGGRAVFASSAERLERFFDRWCPWRADGEGQRRGPEVRAALARGGDVPFTPFDRSRPRTCDQVPAEALRTLYGRLRDAERPEDAMDSFLVAASAGVDDASRLVLKAADQIAVFDLLNAWRPDSPKLAIIRDGRDASISALAFRRLMESLGAPFRADRPSDFWDQLRAWANRAAMVKARADAGELYLVRYEDLTGDFAGTLAPLLEWLGLDAGTEVIGSIERATSFEAMTGRPRGTEARDTRRKGAVGDWLDVLDDRDRAKAWRIAGSQLAAFGYSEGGHELRALRRQMRLADADA